MSMIGGAEASTAAGEILHLIKQLKEKYKDDPKALEGLSKKWKPRRNRSRRQEMRAGTSPASTNTAAFRRLRTRPFSF